MLACEIRRTFEKKLSTQFEIACVATDRFKKCDTFALMIRKKLPGAKIFSREFSANYNPSSARFACVISNWR